MGPQCPPLLRDLTLHRGSIHLLHRILALPLLWSLTQQRLEVLNALRAHRCAANIVVVVVVVMVVFCGRGGGGGGRGPGSVAGTPRQEPRNRFMVRFGLVRILT